MDELIERVALAIWKQRVWASNPGITAEEAARLMAVAAVGAMMMDDGCTVSALIEPHQPDPKCEQN